jgi:hypothetical protein
MLQFVEANGMPVFLAVAIAQLHFESLHSAGETHGARVNFSARGE